jgi:hypothetical protein
MTSRLLILCSALAMPVAVPAQQPAATAKPFTAEFEETAVNKNGEPRIASYQTIAIRGDGARLLKLGLHDGPRYLTYPSGLNVTAHGERKSTTKIGAMTMRSTSNECGGGRPEERGTIRDVFGYRAIMWTDRSSDRYSETWYALDYDCAMLERTLYFNTGEKSILALKSFKESVDPKLFDVDSLIEGPPSQLDQSELGECLANESCKRRLEQRDEAYHANRKRNGLGQ